MITAIHIRSEDKIVVMDSKGNRLSLQNKCTELWNDYSDEVDTNLYIINAVLNILFCVPTVTINAILLAAIWRTPSLRTPSNILICALASTDLCVGLAAQPTFAIKNLSKVTEKLWSLKCVIPYVNGILANLFGCMSFMTFTTISLDKLLVIRLHLRYNTLVSNGKIAFVLAVLFVVSGVFTASRFFSMEGYIVSVVVINCLCFISTFISYAHIHQTVIRHQKQIHNQTLAVATEGNDNRVLQLARFKKRTFSMMYIYAVFLITYLPFLCTVVLLQILEDGAALMLGAKNVAVTIIFFNSIVNPLLVYWKMRDIRKSVKRMVCLKCKKLE